MLFNYIWLRSASIFCCLLLSLSAFGQSAYTTYSRYDSQGHLLGTIAPDPDGSGPLHYPATRNTYSSSTGLLMRSEAGELSTWFDENTMPASWSGFTVYSSKSYVYDAQGRKITEKSYGKNSILIGLIQYTYDSFNRVQCVAQRLNFAVDPALYPNACYLAPEGSYGPDRITRYSYDGTYGLVLTEERALRTTLQQTYVTNTYSGGLLSSQTDANNNKTELYYYPDTKWLKRIVYPSKTKGASNANGTELGTAGDYVEFQYDLNGNKIKERKRSGAIINYTYDNNDRLIEKDLADNSKDVCYNYDLRGLQTEARFGSNPLACSGYGVISNYDGFGRLSSSQNTTLGANLTLNYAYDNNGNRIGIKHPDGVKFGYTFDPLNRVKTLGEATNTGASDYTITSTAITLNYQSNGRRLNISRSGSSTIYNFTDGVHLSSFVQSFSGGSDNNLTNSFTYTAANQIHTLTQSNSNYFYAENKNRTGAYVADGLNRYSSVAGQSLAYDGNSNLTNDGARAYTYDDENRLLSVSGSGLSASLYYDPNGRLFQTTINGSVQRYLFDGDALIAEYNSSNQLQRRYLHGDQVDEPLIQYNGTSATAANRIFLHADHQGSIIAQSSNSGAVTATLAYDAYGIPAAKNALTVGAFGYTGQMYFPELELDYYKARMYHPKLGRFLQTDSIGYKDQMNLYAYVGNDPVNKADPSGNCTAHTTGIGYDCDYNSVAPPVAPPDSNLPPPGTGAIAGAAYGGYAGSVVGGIVSGACDVFTGGVCAPANPAIVGATTIAGAAAGGWLGSKLDKLSNLMFSRSKNHTVPNTGEPGTVAQNKPGTTKKLYGEDGKVTMEWNKGHHGGNYPEVERVDHIHDYKPNPYHPEGTPTRIEPGRTPTTEELKLFGF